MADLIKCDFFTASGARNTRHTHAPVEQAGEDGAEVHLQHPAHHGALAVLVALDALCDRYTLCTKNKKAQKKKIGRTNESGLQTPPFPLYRGLHRFTLVVLTGCSKQRTTTGRQERGHLDKTAGKDRGPIFSSIMRFVSGVSVGRA